MLNQYFCMKNYYFTLKKSWVLNHLKKLQNFKKKIFESQICNTEQQIFVD